jgi:hypothetical protein
MEHMLYPQPGYPFSLRISIEYTLSDSGLQVQTTATNLGTAPRPYGSGAHPYLTLGTANIDPLILRVPARTVLRSDERVFRSARNSWKARDTIFGNRDGSARQLSTMHSPTLTGARMGSLVLSSKILTMELKSRSGLIRATPT